MNQSIISHLDLFPLWMVKVLQALTIFEEHLEKVGIKEDASAHVHTLRSQGLRMRVVVISYRSTPEKHLGQICICLHRHVHLFHCPLTLLTLLRWLVLHLVLAAAWIVSLSLLDWLGRGCLPLLPLRGHVGHGRARGERLMATRVVGGRG